jgi:hypothetical protein
MVTKIENGAAIAVVRYLSIASEVRERGGDPPPPLPKLRKIIKDARMSRASNETRALFLKLHEKKYKPVAIAELLELSRQTITKWIRKIQLPSTGESAGMGSVMGSVSNADDASAARSPSNEKSTHMLFVIYRSKGVTPRVSREVLQAEFEQNPFGLNREIGAKVGLSKSQVHRYRQKLGYTRKVARTTYHEGDDELKKTLKNS